jgi:hypothetical protein
MKIIKAGAIVLSVWAGLNLIVAVAVTVLTVTGGTPPALGLMLNDAQIHASDPKLIAVVNAQAALANPCIVAFCILVLAIVWTSIVPGVRWALWAVAGATIPLQVFAFVSDSFLGGRNLLPNLISSTLLAAGLGLCALGRTAA